MLAAKGISLIITLIPKNFKILQVNTSLTQGSLKSTFLVGKQKGDKPILGFQDPKKMEGTRNLGLF